MALNALRRLQQSYARILAVLAAVLLVCGPGLMATANAAVAASKGAPAVNPAMMFDDTPDIGPMNDAPPPMVGAVNLYFAGVLPSDEVRSFANFYYDRLSWSIPPCAPLAPCDLENHLRPPQG